MKQIVALFFSIICVLSTLSLISASAKTEIAEGAEPNAVDIWNYINNDLPDAVQNGVMSQLVTTLNEQRAGAASQESVDNVQHSIDSIDVKRDSREAIDEWAGTIKDDTMIEKSMGFSTTTLGLSKILWTKIIQELKGEISQEDGQNNGSAFELTIKPDSFTTISDILKTFGYSLVLLFFAISLIEQSIKYELFTLKGGAMVFGRLLFAKVLIDSSVKICMATLKSVNGIAKKILDVNQFELFELPNVNIPASNVPIIGPIIDIFVGFCLSLPLGLITFTVLVLSALISVKLILRAFELAMLTSVSPAYFACFSSEVTRPYFRNFILTFIQVAAQIIFMAIVLYIGTSVALPSEIEIKELSDVARFLGSVLPRTLVLVAMTIMMIKPPKVLTGLIK